MIALNMALNGSSRDETARYLAENFELEDPEALLDEVYARVSKVAAPGAMLCGAPVVLGVPLRRRPRAGSLCCVGFQGRPS